MMQNQNQIDAESEEILLHNFICGPLNIDRDEANCN